ncbi:cyclase family protein [Candidatus Woesebacteria bacterium]|nr:cyclase family protein [Candidatus Woesebacteria bacterium]
MKIIDLTHTFTNSMPVFPGDNLPVLQEHIDTDNDIVHYSLESGMHIGTHMDAPLHMIPGGKKLSEISAEKFIAHGHLVDARGKKEVGAELLDGKEIHEGDCVIVYTGFDEKFREPAYYESYPDLTAEFAHRLVELKIKFVGMDTPSPDKAPYNVHRILLSKEILIIEGLNNLSQLMGIAQFEVFALPAKFEAEAAPVRVIARILT